jgi:hypothetical protein
LALEESSSAELITDRSSCSEIIPAASYVAFPRRFANAFSFRIKNASAPMVYCS